MNSRVRHIAGRTVESAYTQMLYDQRAAAVSRYAPPLTGHPASAENVEQETLLRAWQHPEIADGIEQLRVTR